LFGRLDPSRTKEQIVSLADQFATANKPRAAQGLKSRRPISTRQEWRRRSKSTAGRLVEFPLPRGRLKIPGHMNFKKQNRRMVRDRANH